MAERSLIRTNFKNLVYIDEVLFFLSPVSSGSEFPCA
nr:MAG TPA: hypothetical protein [Caudoviricetes sp.]